LPKTTSAEAYNSYNIYSFVHINLSLWVLHHDCKEHFFTIQLFVRTVDFEFPKKISKTILWFSCKTSLKFLRGNWLVRVFRCTQIVSLDSKDIFGLLDLEDNSQIDLYINHHKIRDKSMIFVFSMLKNHLIKLKWHTPPLNNICNLKKYC